MKEKSNIGRRINKSEDNPYGWIRNLRRGEVKFNKPVVLCLPGDGTQNDSTANGMAKEVEIALGRVGVSKNDIQILAVQYPNETGNKFSSERFYFEKKGKDLDNYDENIKNPKYIKDIYTTVLQPLIINSRGQRFSFDDAQSKFRNLTLFSHCHGTFVACKLMNYLSNEMKKYGYSDKEIKSLTSEIVSIGLSPRHGFHRPDGSTKFGFIMLDDSLARYKYETFFENSGNNCLISSLTLGMEKDDDDEIYMYFSGDNLKYESFEDESDDYFLTIDQTFMHSVNCYTNAGYIHNNNDKQHPVIREKNATGINFSHLIVRAFQNAVSLSKQNIKRTADNIITNKTPITFKQGYKILNPDYINITFEGNNKIFKQNLIDYTKWVMDMRFKAATKKLEEMEENENLLVRVMNNPYEK